jgi:hypothetical protein
MMAKLMNVLLKLNANPDGQEIIFAKKNVITKYVITMMVTAL